MKAMTSPLRVLPVVFAIVAMQAVSSVFLGSYGFDAPQRAVAAPVPASQPSVTVRIDNFTFSPKEVTIAAGTVVTWQNADDVPHTATSKDDPQAFDSGAIDTDEKFSFTFSKPGKYPYYCKVHPHMSGVVIVK